MILSILLWVALGGGLFFTVAACSIARSLLPLIFYGPALALLGAAPWWFT